MISVTEARSDGVCGGKAEPKRMRDIRIEKLKVRQVGIDDR